MKPIRDLSSLIGTSRPRLDERFGPPEVEREVGDDLWLRYALDGVSLRVRCEPGAEGREAHVASWTVSFAEGHGTLRAAAEALGLWPAAGPDCDADEEAPLIRRPLAEGGGHAVHSLTATVRGGRIVQVTAFDEPPDWL